MKTPRLSSWIFVAFFPGVELKLTSQVRKSPRGCITDRGVEKPLIGLRTSAITSPLFQGGQNARKFHLAFFVEDLLEQMSVAFTIASVIPLETSTIRRNARKLAVCVDAVTGVHFCFLCT